MALLPRTSRRRKRWQGPIVPPRTDTWLLLILALLLNFTVVSTGGSHLLKANAGGPAVARSVYSQHERIVTRDFPLPWNHRDGTDSVHRNEDQDSNTTSCGHFRKYPTGQQCDFIRNTSSCHMDGGFLNYLHLPYCLLSGYEAAGLVIIFLWMLYIFFALSVVVDLVLCPSLKMITTALRMDENVAGVTFLAFGNGAADIFSLVLLVLRGDDDDDEDDVTGEAGMGSIIGGGMFVTCISAGLIAFNYPLENIEKWPFIRNILFYVASVAWLVGMLADSKIYLGEAIGFICLYLFYVFIVWIGHRKSLPADNADTQEGRALLVDERTPLLADRSENGSAYGAGSSDGTVPDGPTKPPSKSGRGLQSRTRDAAILPTVHAIDLSLSTSTASMSESRGEEDGHRATLSDSTLESFPDVEQRAAEQVPAPEVPLEPDYIVGLRQLGNSLVAKELRHPMAQKWYHVVLAVLAFPVRLPILLTCPTVDPEEDDKGWNKYLTVITMVTFLSFAALSFDGFFEEVHNELLLGPLLAIVGGLFAMAVFIFTEVRKPPSWIVLFSVLSFCMSIVWIYIMADEVVNIVVTFSVALDVTGSLLGLLMIATGNSVCDLIANFLVARSGKPLMGFAASYGSPLLNMLIGIGIASTAAIIKNNKPYALQFPLLLKVASGFLCFALLLAVAMVMVRRWSAGRLLGSTMIFLYLAFFGAMLGIELGVVDTK